MFRSPFSSLAAVIVLAGALAGTVTGAALADADEAPAGVDTTVLGLQPLKGPLPRVTPAPGESRIVPRADGTFEAIPEVRGRTKIFRLVEREAPWTIKPGLTVMAKTYNGVVPGPVLSVSQGDRVVIELTNRLDVADTLHLHGIHGAPAAMDGVAGSTQAAVPPKGGRFQYAFSAGQNGTFIYHTHGPEELLNAGLYGALVVKPQHPRPEERADRDYVAIVSSWKIQSASENHFTLNGKSYPSTTAFEVARGERVRIRWINISGENLHTMHTHGHDMRIIARDAQPLEYKDIQDTLLLGPGQRADALVVADAQPGTWIIHCHVVDHTEDGSGHPDGLISALHYRGTPNTLLAMGKAMQAMDMAGPPAPRRSLDFGSTVLLGAIAGLTIFFGLPIARMRRLPIATVAALNAVAIGILVFLVVEIAHGATLPIERGIAAWQKGSAFPFSLTSALIAGLVAGLVGLGSIAGRLSKGKTGVEDPYALSMMIAVGIGAHNFAEGLAIGASAASGATALAIGLIVGFALHNATEGFGVAAPLAGRETIPSWGKLLTAGVVAGGPTFLGTIVGYTFVSPVLSTLFLAIAAGALVFVIGELWALLKKLGGATMLATSMVSLGFIIALATEIVVGIQQRPQPRAQVTTSANLPAARANDTSMAMRSPTDTSRPQR